MVRLTAAAMVFTRFWCSALAASKNFEKCQQSDKCHDPFTFGMDFVHLDPCTPMTTARFREIVNQRVPCTGEYCLDGKFNCPSDGRVANCYHVEHILDEHGCDYHQDKFRIGARSGKKCGPEPKNAKKCHPSIKNIAANYVMAWGAWNSGLPAEYGPFSPCHKKAQNAYRRMLAEKEEIYGVDRVDKARAEIFRCFKAKPELYTKDKGEL